MFNFAQKELAPKADEIDKKNQFDNLRVSDRPYYLFFQISRVGSFLYDSIFDAD